jgi:hypothetical protein
MDTSALKSRYLACTRAASGLTILECLLAAAVVAIAGISIAFVLAAGRARFDYTDKALRCTRLGEHLLEEVATKPYFGAGAVRRDWCVDDYDGFSDGPEDRLDSLGGTYAEMDREYQREVSVQTASQMVPDFGNFTIAGKLATVRVKSSDGSVYELSRFISEPAP